MPDAISTPVAITNREPWQLLLPLSQQGSLARPPPQASDVMAEGRKSKGQWMEGHQAEKSSPSFLLHPPAVSRKTGARTRRYCLFLKESLLLEGGGVSWTPYWGLTTLQNLLQIRLWGRAAAATISMQIGPSVEHEIVPGCDIWMA